MIEARTVTDSIANDVRLTTLQLKYPRFIHSEFMTHRVFSRNASSSRAIPVQRMIDEVNANPAMPSHWGKNQAGMQAYEEGVPAEGIPAWKQAKSWAVESATWLNRKGFHKQIVNRLLEPFQHISVIVTATEWQNFFELRDHAAAQPEIRDLARAMREAMDESEPMQLGTGAGHLPYVDHHDFDYLYDSYDEDFVLEAMVKCSIARCARVSYLNHDKSKPDITKDIALADKLIAMGHMSPTEHQATPMDSTHWAVGEDWMDSGVTHMDREGQLWSGNFRGWVQYRQLL